MSIYGAMFSGVSGLAAQSQALGMIADNISNLNTVGYKSTVARFQTLVTEASSTTTYSPGGVRSTPYQKIDRQGLLQGSTSPTDIALVGNGFFVVNEDSVPGIGDDYLFTRAGNFTPNENGDLVSSAGYYLQGWRLDSTGALPANTTTLNSLDTVNISNLTGAARATSAIQIASNLPGQTAPGDAHAITVQVYDKQGNTQNLTLHWVKTSTNNWALVGEFPGTGQFASDDTAGASLSGSPISYFPLATLTATTSMTLLSAAGNITGAVGAFAVAAPAGAPPSTDAITVTIGADAFTATVPTVVGNDLDNTSNIVFTGAGGRTFTLDLQGATTYDLDVGGDRTTLQNNLNAAFAGVTFANGAVAGVPLGTAIFNADGTLGSLLATAPYATVNAASEFEFYVDYDSDVLTTSTQDRQLVVLDVGTPGLGDGLTQYSGSFFTSVIQQDGLSFGSFTGVTIDEAGIVTALFDNGQQRDIYKLPIATFRNSNGLKTQIGNAYLQTNHSGNVLLLEANAGGAGKIAPNSLESSTVDLAEEFTSMIITQRAYSASAKVITTADDMLEELIRIRR
ncbi:MAG: flagellar hook-basal body complex protein [Dongiaceae bacterium]